MNDSNQAALSTLFPVTSRAIRRVTAEAESRGLIAVPYTYVVLVGANQAGQSTVLLQLDTPAAQGPFIVTDLVVPDGRDRALMRVRNGGAYLTDGVVVAGDALELPRLYCGRLMASPICINAGDTMAVQLDAGSAFSANEGLRINGFGVRMPSQGRRQLGPVPDDLAADWLAAVAADGQWWASSVESAVSAFASVSGDVVVETAIMAVQRPTPESTEERPSDLVVQVGDHYLTPQGGPLLGPLMPDGVTHAVIMPGLRWPLPSSTRIQVRPQYLATADPPLPVRVTLVGRRGGVAGGCW